MIEDLIDDDTLVRLVERGGLAAAEPQVRRLVAIARRRGLDQVAVDVLADRSEPEVVRLRALAHVQRRIAQLAPGVDLAAAS